MLIKMNTTCSTFLTLYYFVYHVLFVHTAGMNTLHFAERGGSFNAGFSLLAFQHSLITRTK